MACNLLFKVKLASAFHEQAELILMSGRLYRGYSISPLGSVIGLIWGLVDGLIGGAIFAWLYNLITGKLEKKGK